MFLPDLPPHLRFSLSTAIHILGGLMVVFGLEMGNDLVGLLAVGLFRSVPASWFPLYDHPWRATSLHDFWGRRWHQILRHMFLSLGGYPGLWVGGNIGLVLGTFLASGMYHALGLQMADHRIVLFFVLQGLGILLENVYRRCTGRRVGGVAGWCWTAFWVVVLGQMCSTPPLASLKCQIELTTLFRSGCMVDWGSPRGDSRPQETEHRQALRLSCSSLPRAVCRVPSVIIAGIGRNAPRSECM